MFMKMHLHSHVCKHVHLFIIHICLYTTYIPLEYACHVCTFTPSHTLQCAYVFTQTNICVYAPLSFQVCMYAHVCMYIHLSTHIVTIQAYIHIQACMSMHICCVCNHSQLDSDESGTIKCEFKLRSCPSLLLGS